MRFQGDNGYRGETRSARITGTVSTKPQRPALWFLRLLPFGISIAGLLAALMLCNLLVRRELTELSERTRAEAKHVGAQVRVGVLEAFDPLQRIAAWWLSQGRPLAPEDWETDAQLFVKAHTGLRMVTWVTPNGARSWPVRPGVSRGPKSYERPDEELQQVLKVARRLGSLAISRVLLIQGAPRLYACVPVKRGRRLAGFAAALYDPAELIHATLEGQLPDDYSVTVTLNGHEFSGGARVSSPAFSGIASETQLMIANTVWSVRVVPSAGELSTLRRLVIGFGLLVSVLLYACTATAVVARGRAAQLATANQRLAIENQERSRAEEKIRELNRDLQRRLHDFDVLLEVLPIGITVAEDPECRRIWMNRSMAALLQVPLEQNISKSVGSADQLTYRIEYNGVEVPAEDLPMQVAARTGRPISNRETDIVRGDGSMINTLSYSSPVFDESGGVRGVISACVDITERKRAEEERRSNLIRRRELEQRVEKYESLAMMAGGIAHDFNNLLTVIVGNANLLALDTPLDPQVSSRVAELLAAANRAAELTSRLLAFTGRIWCNAQPVDLSATVASAERTLRDLVPSNIELRCELGPDLPIIKADVSEIQQVLRNLVENAVEAFDGSTGRIEIRVSACEFSGDGLSTLYPGEQLAPGRYVRLEVSDNGCGVPDKITARVFDPFFTTKFVGRGLGLSAAQGIIRAHGGGIRLASVVEHGTRVEIVLPA